MQDWAQALTIIVSIVVPMIGGLSWFTHRMDKKFEKVDTKFDKVDAELIKINERINSLEVKVGNLDMRVGFIERLFEMMGAPFKITQIQQKTDP